MIVPARLLNGPEWVWFVWFATPSSAPKPVMRITPPAAGAVRANEVPPCATNGDRPVVELANTPKWPQSLPIATFANCTDAGSIAYWCCGGGFCGVPLASDAGTLNWTTVAVVPSKQWPAVSMAFGLLSNIHAVQPTGMIRPTRGSVDAVRSSVGPQIDATLPSTTMPACTSSTPSRAELPSAANTSMLTESPLKYAVL